ncbi:MAG: hypothetical protein JSR44_12825 [Spirochaetes bacterium]|nr:hypothetical protein [Spirochaetota bacterium]
MKKAILITLGILAATAIDAANLHVETHEQDLLPAKCQLIAEIKIGDIAWGKSRADVVAEMKKEAAELGGNYVLMDIKRVNHPKMGVYYWGWGKVGNCK